jgi:hypothetical protein
MHRHFAQEGPYEDPEDDEVKVVGALEAQAGPWVAVAEEEEFGGPGAEVEGWIEGREMQGLWARGQGKRRFKGKLQGHQRARISARRSAVGTRSDGVAGALDKAYGAVRQIEGKDEGDGHARDFNLVIGKEDEQQVRPLVRAPSRGSGRLGAGRLAA